MSALRLHMRTRAALTLNRVMQNERLRTPTLAQFAGVSETYVRYLSRFAQRHKQISYLCSKVDDYSYGEYLNPLTVVLPKADFDYLDFMGGSTSGHIRKALKQWSKKNGYYSGSN